MVAVAVEGQCPAMSVAAVAAVEWPVTSQRLRARFIYIYIYLLTVPSRDALLGFVAFRLHQKEILCGLFKIESCPVEMSRNPYYPNHTRLPAPVV